MSVVKGSGRRDWSLWAFVFYVGLAWVSPSGQAHAICGLDPAIYEQISNVQDLNAARSWKRYFQQERNACAACHIAGFGPRNQYGSAINVFLTGIDRPDSARKREAGLRVSEIPANPFLNESPTFGDLIKQGFLPASDFMADPAFRLAPGRPSEEITVQRARELVRQVQSDSRFGVLQLSQTYKITPEVAKELAEFQGEFLILGLKTLEPAVAEALAKSRAANLWLHSVTQVMGDSAVAISKVSGHLVLSGLVDLSSVPLAQKLARRPAALSFPYLTRITPEVAAALGKGGRALTFPALTDPPVEVQEKLAEAEGALTIPGLTSLKSMSLTRKLASGFASSVLLPAIKSLSVGQAKEIASVNRPVIFGGILLPLSVMTEEVATVFANNPGAGRLELVGRLNSDATLKVLVQSSLSIALRDVEDLSQEQVRILSNASDSVPGGPFGTQIKIRLPRLKALDSPLLAQTLLRCSADFCGIKTISMDAAAALASAPEMGARNRLSFPSLERLSPQTARTLMVRPWSLIYLPALQDVSPETARILAGLTSHLTLGIHTMSPELAASFSDMASNEIDLGGGTLEFPSLKELSPKAARALVNSLNRGIDVRSWGGLSRAPQLFLGGRNAIGLSFNGSSPPLTPELAAELAKYLGRLSIAGLQELSPKSASELVPYHGPRLELSGPATNRLPPATAEALAMFPGVLDMELRVLDSSQLGEKFALQSSRTTDRLELIAAGAIPNYVRSKDFFTHQQLLVLDSPALAARLILDSSGQVLPSLRVITPAAAKVLATSSNPLYLGLIMLDDPEVARAIAMSPKGATLPRLRAATPEVIAVLRAAKSIKTPALEGIHVLSESRPN